VHARKRRHVGCRLYNRIIIAYGEHVSLVRAGASHPGNGPQNPISEPVVVGRTHAAGARPVGAGAAPRGSVGSSRVVRAGRQGIGGNHVSSTATADRVDGSVVLVEDAIALELLVKAEDGALGGTA